MIVRRINMNGKMTLQQCQGFSLIEMAIVMLIMGSLLSGLLVTLTQTSENNRRRAAESQLQRIEEALYGFAQVNGRLPCPAISTSDGLEDPIAGGDCTSNHGFVPNATLNLYGNINNDGLMMDPWANPYRYSVSDLQVSGGDKAFTSNTGLSTLFNDESNLLAAGPNMIQVCTENTCTVEAPLSDIVPVVVFSMGNNWVTTNSTCGAVVNTDENENAGEVLDGTHCVTNTMDFVSRTYIQDVFDDIVIWLSPHVLFSRLINAGQLP